MAAIDPVSTDLDGSLEADLSELSGRVLAMIAGTLDPTIADPNAPFRFPTLEASQLYRHGMRERTAGRALAADSLFRAAYQRDTTFLEALVAAAGAQWDHGRYEASEPTVRFLRPRRARLRPVDAAMLDLAEARLAGDFRGAYAATSSLAELSDGILWQIEHARSAFGLVRMDEVLEILSRLDPEISVVRESEFYWWMQCVALWMRGDLDRALALAEEAEAVGVDLPRTRRLMSNALAALGRTDEVMARLDQLQVAADGIHRPWVEAFGILSWAGRPAAAQEVARRAVRRIRTIETEFAGDSRWGDLDYQWGVALTLAGRYEEAIGAFDRSLDNPDGWEDFRFVTHGYRGYAAAMSGDTSRAEESLAYLDRVQPLPYTNGDDRVRAAAILGALGRMPEAVQAIRAARREGIVPPIYWREFSLLPLKDNEEAMRVLFQPG
jgi:tetratricopeptide (TPR) repeat protein